MLGLTHIIAIIGLLFSSQEIVSRQNNEQWSQPDSLLLKANNHFYHRQFDSAIYLYQKIIETENFESPQYFRAVVRLAHAYMSYGTVDTVRVLLNNIDFPNTKDRNLELQAEINYIKGHLHYIFNEIDSAKQYLSFASALCQQTDNDSLPVLIIKDFGNISFTSNQYDDALEHYEEALRLEKERIIPSELIISSLYQNISLVYAKKFEYRNANYYFKNSLEIKEKILSSNDILLIRAYINYSLLLTEIGDYQNALEFSNLAEKLLVSKFTRDHYLLGHIYHNKSLILEKTGKSDQAIVYMEKALQYHMNLFPNDHNWIALFMLNMGFSLFNKGDIQKSAIYFHQSIYHASDPYTKLNAINMLAVCSDRLGNFVEAANYFESGLEIIEADSFHNSFISTQLLSSYGKFLEKNESSQALKFLKRSYNIAKQVEDPDPSVVTYSINNLADYYYKQQKYDSALYYFQNALVYYFDHFTNSNLYINPDYTNIKTNNRNLYHSLYGKALSLLNIRSSNRYYDLTKCIETCNLAEQCSNQLRIFSNDYNTLFSGNNLVTTSEIALNALWELSQLSNNNEYLIEIENIIISSKVANLKASIQNYESIEYSKIPDDLMEMEIDLRRNIISPVKNSQKNQTPIIDISPSIDFITDNRLKALIEYDSLITFLEHSFPDYYALKYENQSPSLLEIQQKLNEKSALVDYSVFDTNLYIAVITKDSFQLKRILIDEDFQSSAVGYFRAIKKAAPKKQILDTSYYLFSTLIKPIYELIEHKENLIIIPDNYLYYIPFETLVREPPDQDVYNNIINAEFLILRHSFSYHYSAALWEKSQRGPQEIEEPNGPFNYIGFAPVFSNNEGPPDLDRNPIVESNPSISDFRSGDLDKMDFSFLPYSKVEVESISNLFRARGLDNRLLIDHEATEQNFKDQIKGYSIIHIATHAFSNDEEPELSGMAFSDSKGEETNKLSLYPDFQISIDSENGHENDGILYAGEMYNLNMEAELVVLSACETGVGKLVKGEGMIAMTRGLIYSGAKNILYTLWKISDRHTQELMVDFYSKVLEGSTYSEALRYAKLQMLKDESTAYPNLWGGYMLIGQ